MKDLPHQPTVDDELPHQGESFLARFHRRKTEARHVARPASPDHSEAAEPVVVDQPEPPASEPTDEDMPPLESLTSDSDYTGFLSPKVSEALRRAALRKLFHSAGFNVVDGLDEYADDFTSFQPLGGIVTADMRHMMEVEARKQAEALKRALVDDDQAAPPDAGGAGPEQTAGTSPAPTHGGTSDPTAPPSTDHEEARAIDARDGTDA